LLVALPAILLSVSVGASAAGARPKLQVSAPALGCPAIEGAFVVLLDPARGMLLMSAAEFPGGHAVGRGSGDALRVELPRSGAWELARAGSADAPVQLWGAAYRSPMGGAPGCVAFDRDQYSSEGDLVTYAQWLVKDVYLRLPKAEREAFPALRVADRTVRLRLHLAGYVPVPLETVEGGTLAIRVPGGPQTLLLRPFVLDEATGRVVIDVSITDQPYWQRAEKRSLGFVVASASQPGALAEPAGEILVEMAAAPTADTVSPH
jgi:hypothetical protein